LIEAAAAHGVLPSAGRHLRAISAARGASAIVSAPDASARVDEALSEIDRRLVLVAGLNMLIGHHAGRITEAFARAALPACIVKGPVFARRLYARPSDRGFTDLDLLVAPDALDACATILRDLGFVMAPGDPRHTVAHAEYKWTLPGNDLLLIEVQTNLIHSPNLFSGISLSYADVLAAGDGDPEDATALLLVAAVHGAAGHQFDRLQPAVDVLMAVRGAAGPINRERLDRVARRIGASVALHAALDLVARLFKERAARDLAAALSPAPWALLRRKLLSPAVALRAQAEAASRDSWRRRALREMIRRGGTPVRDR
jgi:hypothetical protein